MSELTSNMVIVAHNEDPGGVGYNSTVNATGPLSGQTWTGTAGYDRIFFNTFTEDLLADLTTDTVSEIGGAGTATFSDFEAVIMGSGMDTIRWAVDATALTEAYRFDGGSGYDTIDLADITLGAGQVVTGIDLDGGCVFGMDNGNAVDFAYLTSFERVTSSADGDFTITGTDDANLFLMMGIGDDSIFGFGGDDILDGGAGDDVLDGGDGEDAVSYENATSGVSAYLSFDGRDVGGGMGSDTFVSIENFIGSGFADRLVGDTGDNQIFAGNGDDVIKGKDGNDILSGQGGDDRLIAGSGTDLLAGGDGSDVLIGLGGNDSLNGNNDRDFIYGGQGDDTVRGGLGDDEVRGNRGNDNLFGDEGEDDLRGGGGSDILDGGLDDDFLFGENGSDVLFGDAGDDVMTGGVGGGVFDGQQDTFVYAPVGGFDRIKDFEDGTDLISLATFGFTDFTTDVLPLASTSGSGVRLDFGGGNVLFIENFSLADFDATDVILSF